MVYRAKSSSVVGASTGQGLKGQDMGPRRAREVCGIRDTQLVVHHPWQPPLGSNWF